jgi:hypothetical protein
VTRVVATCAALVSAIFFGLNALGSKVLYAPGPHFQFDAVSLT